jgi:two-component system, chemotaxis family, chemotaxis protein CheY
MKILLVDDSKAMRLIVRRTLREAGYGHETFSEATNGEEAYAQVQADCPDLLLCDWNMPRLSGIELLEKLRATGCKAKFGFVTSESNPEMRARAVAAGAQFLIAKPFTADDFQDALEKEFGR